MVSDKVIILRTFRHSDSDLIIHFLRSSGSKLGVFARGALKSKKRFGGGVLEPGNFVAATFQVPKDQDQLGQLTEAQLIYSFDKLRTEYQRLELALYFLSLIDKVSLFGEELSHGSFDLLGNSLKAAEVSDRLDLLRLHFQIKFLGYQGVLPAMAGIERFSLSNISDHEKLAALVEGGELSSSEGASVKLKTLSQNLELQIEHYLKS